MRKCLYCNHPISGRSDKKYCNYHCKSAHRYILTKENEGAYKEIDTILKRNRKILKKYSVKGKTVIRQSTLHDLGFNPNYFTHFWRNYKGQVYFFCYEYGFMPLIQKGIQRYLLVQWQPYMEKKVE